MDSDLSSDSSSSSSSSSSGSRSSSSNSDKSYHARESKNFKRNGNDPKRGYETDDNDNDNGVSSDTLLKTMGDMFQRQAELLVRQSLEFESMLSATPFDPRRRRREEGGMLRGKTTAPAGSSPNGEGTVTARNYPRP